MRVCLQINPGFLHVSLAVLGTCDAIVDDPSIQTLAGLIGKNLSTLVRGRTVAKPPGSRGFSFHWSNAQATWDVIPANDPAWSLDGAEFLVYVHQKVLSPLGKPWSAKEMQYVAKHLPPHPGYSGSAESMWRSAACRVAARYLAAQEG